MDIKISLIVPCHNAGIYLTEAIDSVLRQRGKFELAEVIIVDDRSDDPATRKALREVATLDRVIVLSNTGPRGAAAARNTGLTKARSQWIAFLDADDILTDGSLEARCNAARTFPDVGWIGGDISLANRDGVSLGAPMLQSGEIVRPILAEAFRTGQPIRLRRPVEAFIRSPACHTCSILVRRDLVERVGGFDTELIRQQDYHMFLKLAAISDFVFTPYVVMLYRQHDSNSTKDAVQLMSWRAKALLKLGKEQEFKPFRTQLRRKVSEVYLARAYESRRQKRRMQAIISSALSCYYAPASPKGYRSLAASLLR